MFFFEAALFGNVRQTFTAEFVFRKRFAPASRFAPRCYSGNVRTLLPAVRLLLVADKHFQRAVNNVYRQYRIGGKVVCHNSSGNKCFDAVLHKAF